MCGAASTARSIFSNETRIPSETECSDWMLLDVVGSQANDRAAIKNEQGPKMTKLYGTSYKTNGESYCSTLPN